MARPLSSPGGRPHRRSTALSTNELAILDMLRGKVKPGVYLRLLVLAEKERRDAEEE